MLQHWNEYRYPMWFMTVIAVLEKVCAIGMLVAFWVPGVLKVFAHAGCADDRGDSCASFSGKAQAFMAIHALVMLGITGVVLS